MQSLIACQRLDLIYPNSKIMVCIKLNLFNNVLCMTKDFNFLSKSLTMQEVRDQLWNADFPDMILSSIIQSRQYQKMISKSIKVYSAKWCQILQIDQTSSPEKLICHCQKHPKYILFWSRLVQLLTCYFHC